MDVSPINKTIETYDKIAEQYFLRWQDRSPIESHFERFIAMLRAYDLGSSPILDIGCGPGFDSNRFRNEGFRVISIDLSSQMLAFASTQYPGLYIKADMRFLPFSDGIGGLWIAASFLHVPKTDVLTTLQNFYSVLQPGGLIYLSLKIGDSAGWNDYPYQLPRYFVYHQPDELDSALKATGFDIIEGWQALSGNTNWLIRFGRKGQIQKSEHRLSLTAFSNS